MSEYKFTHKRKDLSKAKIEITFKAGKDALDLAKEKAYQKLAKQVDIKGFRPGQAPRNMVESAVGSRFFEEAVNILLPAIAEAGLKAENLRPIAPLHYDLTKYAEGGDIEFKATVHILPDFDLKKLEKIKVKKEDLSVSKAEIQKVIENMYKDSQAKKAEKKDEGLEIVGDDKRKTSKSDTKKEEKVKMPEGKAADEWVKTLNLAVNSLTELEERVKSELEYQKKYYSEQKYQYTVLEEAMKLSDAEVPETTVEHEIEHRMEHFMEDLLRLEMTMEKYLAANNTTEEKIKEEWKTEIAKSIMAELVIEQIARKLELRVSEEEIHSEIEKIQDKKLRERYETPDGHTDIMLGLRKNKALKYLFETVEGKSVTAKVADTKKAKTTKKK